MNCEMQIAGAIRRKIWIVGDASSDLKDLRSALVADGFHVRFSGTAESALAEWRRWQFDIVILDETVPDVIAAFRQISARVVVLARTRSLANCIDLLDAGADDCVGTTCSVAELRARIRSKLRSLSPCRTQKKMKDKTL
jgi:DNA-binding response OmpR family regulator